MKRSLIVLSVVSLVFAGVASAEVRKGDVLLDAAAGWTQQDFKGGGDIDIFFGVIRPGYAFTDNIRGAVVGAIAYVDVGSTDVTTFALGVSGEYVFMPANQFNPYVGGMFAWADADADNAGDVDGWLAAPRVGFLYTLNTTNNLFGEFQYHFWGGDIDDVLDDGFMVLFGIEHKFKVGQ
jgi:hypothetical protein